MEQLSSKIIKLKICLQPGKENRRTIRSREGGKVNVCSATSEYCQANIVYHTHESDRQQVQNQAQPRKSQNQKYFFREHMLNLWHTVTIHSKGLTRLLKGCRLINGREIPQVLWNILSPFPEVQIPGNWRTITVFTYSYSLPLAFILAS